MSFQIVWDSLFPQFMKHFSVGSTVGITLGLVLSMFVEGTLFYMFLGLYIILSITGIYKTKDDWKEHFK